MLSDRKTISHISDVSQPELITIIDRQAAVGKAYQQNNLLIVGRVWAYYAEECEIQGQNGAIIICIIQQTRGSLPSEYPSDFVLYYGGRCPGVQHFP